MLQVLLTERLFVKFILLTVYYTMFYTADNDLMHYALYSY
jgi:hypothetical protein